MQKRSGPAPQTVTLPEAARILGIGRNSAYLLAKRGELPVLRLGHRLVMSRRALYRLLDEGQPKPVQGEGQLRGGLNGNATATPRRDGGGRRPGVVAGRREEPRGAWQCQAVRVRIPCGRLLATPSRCPTFPRRPSGRPKGAHLRRLT